jgi:hypothetical protein
MGMFRFAERIFFHRECKYMILCRSDPLLKIPHFWIRYGQKAIYMIDRSCQNYCLHCGRDKGSTIFKMQHPNEKRWLISDYGYVLSQNGFGALLIAANSEQSLRRCVLLSNNEGRNVVFVVYRQNYLPFTL